MQDIDGIIFDLDGVLTDTEPVHEKADAEVLAAYGVKIDERWNEIRGLTQINVFRTAVRMYNIAADPQVLVERKMVEFRKVIGEIRAFDGAIETLKWASSRYKVALVSSSPRECVYATIDNTGMRDFFDVIITGDDTINGKPDPEPYLRAVAMLGLKPPQCVVVEDSLHGIRSAKAAGIYCIAITNTFTKQELIKAGADIAIDKITEIKNIL